MNKNRIKVINLNNLVSLNNLVIKGDYEIKGVCSSNNNLPNSVNNGEFVTGVLKILDNSDSSKNVSITQVLLLSSNDSDIYIRKGIGDINSIIWYDWESAFTVGESSGSQSNEFFINWNDNTNLNNYTANGLYNIEGSRINKDDNMPILNVGKIKAKLTVLQIEDCVTQVLTLVNVGGGEGNVYIRTKQGNTWKTWGKLQNNIEVGLVDTLDNLRDNGIYSGILNGSNFDTFVLVVINNYAAAVPAGFGWYVSQLKYSLGLDGSVTVKTRRMDYTNSWSEWEELKGGGGSNNITRYYCDEIGGETVWLYEMIPKNVGDISIIIGDHYVSPLLTTTAGDTAYCMIELQNYNLLKFKFYDAGKNYYLELEDTTDVYGYKPGGGFSLNGNNVIRGVIGTGVTVKFDTSLRYDLKMGDGTLKFFNGGEYKSYVDCNVRSIGLSSSKAIVESSNGNEIVVQQISTN